MQTYRHAIDCHIYHPPHLLIAAIGPRVCVEVALLLLVEGRLPACELAPPHLVQIVLGAPLVHAPVEGSLLDDVVFDSAAVPVYMC